MSYKRKEYMTSANGTNVEIELRECVLMDSNGALTVDNIENRIKSMQQYSIERELSIFKSREKGVYVST